MAVMAATDTEQEKRLLLPAHNYVRPKSLDECLEALREALGPYDVRDHLGTLRRQKRCCAIATKSMKYRTRHRFLHYVMTRIGNGVSKLGMGNTGKSHFPDALRVLPPGRSTRPSAPPFTPKSRRGGYLTVGDVARWTALGITHATRSYN